VRERKSEMRKTSLTSANDATKKEQERERPAHKKKQPQQGSGENQGQYP